MNFGLLAAVIAVILASAAWRPGLDVTVYGVRLEMQNIGRDVALVGLALASLRWTPKALREENGFGWEPIREVAKIFVAIFLCIVPVLAMLAARDEGALSGLVAFVTGPDGLPSTPPISGSPARCPPSSTTSRPISCSSSSPAAMPGS